MIVNKDQRSLARTLSLMYLELYKALIFSSEELPNMAAHVCVIHTPLSLLFVYLK